uniref:Disease resistance protein At4g27190-like leucine-rich repeats domain-containing protein n=1 Tax=Oryza nivara TaxID=4536 RepID=A0A0E0IE68_ORYNI
MKITTVRTIIAYTMHHVLATSGPNVYATAFQEIRARDVGAAREETLNLIQSNININRKMTMIYFQGWYGFGRTGVLRSIAEVLPSMKPYPPELRFDRTIYIDCSRWKSKRVMQRKIAEELKLDNETMASFDKQDEEDDFSGVDICSRDAILNVSAAISRILSQSRFLMVFLNGSDDEIPLSTFGIEDYFDCVVIWTWSRMFLTVMDVSYLHSIYRKIKEGRYTDLFIYGYQDADKFSSSEFGALFREEAATIGRCPCLQNIDLEIVADCCLYGFLMYYHNKQNTNEFVWPAHASNYWTCDGIIQGARALEVSNALHPEVSFECRSYELKRVVEMLKMDPKAPFLLLEDDNKFVYSNSNRPYRWVFAISNDTIEEAMQTKMTSASSIFLATQMYSGGLLGIPDGFFEQCSSLCVLVLSCCAFNFVSPPFLHCQTLKFIGLDRCKSNSTVELQGKWACLQNLRVIDLRYTDWVEIFHEEKMELMTNQLMEVNIEGVRCSQLTSQLKKRLPCLERLRIINPQNEAETSSSSTDINDIFVDKTDLQLLDLSGNKEKKNLPTSISNAGQLKVLILDGCDALEDVVVPNRLPSSLRSFSFDGYGSAAPSRASTIELPLQSCRPVRRGMIRMKDVKTSVISLEGCTQLDNLFLRGLPNLVELDLSGCAIKVLDFGTMVTDVPCLKRLFLLGCEHLRAIRWGPNERQSTLLELLCIDTRPARKVLGCARPSLAVEHKSFQGADEDGRLEIIWASDLLKAHCIWSRGIKSSDGYLQSLQHLHLRSCPSLRFALPMALPSFPSLETLHIIHCGDLRHIFVPDTEFQSTSIEFPKLTTIHLHDLPSLRQICEAVEMVAPALETIRIRGCWSLRRLPRSQGKQKPAIEVEKDVWDALEWDGVDAGHHPSLYQPPQHSRYYKNKRMPRGTLLGLFCEPGYGASGVPTPFSVCARPSDECVWLSLEYETRIRIANKNKQRLRLSARVVCEL